MESELIALDTTSNKTEWIRDLLIDIPVIEAPLPTVSLYSL